MNIYLEIFGYIGTALVLTSMLMTSVVKLRIFNVMGSVISAIYAFLTNTWPVVVLNLALVVINVIQLIRLSRVKASFDHTQVSPEDKTVHYFLQYYLEDIRQYFPDFSSQIPENSVIHMVYCSAEPVGLLIGTQKDNALQVQLDYAIPKYRDCSIATYLFDKLKTMGITTLIATGDTKLHAQYLQKMGFETQNGKSVKQL